MSDLQQAMEARGEHGQNNDVLRAEVKRLREDLERVANIVGRINPAIDGPVLRTIREILDPYQTDPDAFKAPSR